LAARAGLLEYHLAELLSLLDTLTGPPDG